MSSDTPNNYAQSTNVLWPLGTIRLFASSPVGSREMRRAYLVGVLCLVGLIQLPMAAATQPQPKELYKLYAHTQLLNDKEYRCLKKLWDRESRWDPTADNPKSSAYGIPQLLRLKETNPFKQIDRGLSYIKHRHGTPCKAYAYHLKKGHY